MNDLKIDLETTTNLILPILTSPDFIFFSYGLGLQCFYLEKQKHTAYEFFAKSTTFQKSILVQLDIIHINLKISKVVL